MMEKGLYLFKGKLSAFLASPIKALGWKQFFEGVTAIRPDVINLFYKSYMSMEKHYALMKGKKVKFEPATINVLYELEQIAV